jgi:diketogulonate reductase-like aldo/keto reductase
MVLVSSADPSARGKAGKRFKKRPSNPFGPSSDATFRRLVAFLAVVVLTGLLTLKVVYRNGNGRDSDGKIPWLGSVMMMASAHTIETIINSGKPFLLYGTAWKKELTAQYVAQAVQAGFRFIDTACQPKHYNEPGVGDGWSAAAHELGLPRSAFFLQTKFTSVDGQDPNLIPYDRDAPIEDQVRQSLEVSLSNLKTTYLDSLVLHSPFPTMEDTMRAWRTMEGFVDAGKVRRLGISNCYEYEDFVSIYESARIKPSVLQNRFYDESNFDTDLRAFCKAKGIWYQSFWTLTANRHALAGARAKEMAQVRHLTPQTLLYAFLMQLGYVTPLSGTTSEKHMREDVAVMERMQGGEKFFRSDEELREFAQLLGMPDL